MSSGARKVVVAIFLLTWILTAVLAALQSRYTASAWVVLALGGVILLRLVPLIFYRPEYGWFHPLVFGSLLSLVMLPRSLPLYIWGVQSHSALPGWTGEGLTRLIAFDLALSILGLIAYYVGFFCIPTPRTPRLSSRRIRSPGWRAVVVILFSAAVFSVYMQTQGGIISHLVSWQLGRRAAMAGEYYWSFFIGFGAIAALIWISLEPRIVIWPWFWGCAMVLLAMQFLTTGSRSSLLFTVGLAMMVWMLTKRKVIVGRALFAGLLGLVLLGTLGTLRRTIQIEAGKLDWSVLARVATGFQESIAEIRERSGTEATSYAVLARVPDEVPLLYGASYGSLVARPVPRALWPDKPVTVEAMAGATFHGVAHGRPIGAVAEAYWNLYIPGVLLAFLLLGWFHRWLAKAYRAHAAHPGAPALYALILYYAAPSSSGIFALLMVLVPALIILRFMGGITPGLRGGVRVARPEPA